MRGWLASMAALCVWAGQVFPAELQAGVPGVEFVLPGIFRVGKVVLNKTNRTVSFPARVNMAEAIVEYVAVTPNGKTHESLLRVLAEPHQIHVAMLLLGASGAANASFPTNPAVRLPGERIEIAVRWKANDQEKETSVASWLRNRKRRAVMSDTDWVYTGSRTSEGKFVAQRDGSVVSLITDPDALVNNARADRDDDELWEVNTTAVPPLDTEVTVIFRLPKVQGSTR